MGTFRGKNKVDCHNNIYLFVSMAYHLEGIARLRVMRLEKVGGELDGSSAG